MSITIERCLLQVFLFCITMCGKDQVQYARNCVLVE